MAADFRSQYLDLVKATPYLQTVLRPGKDPVGFESFTYKTVFQLAAVGTPTGAFITTQSDSDFVIAGLSGLATSAIGGFFFNKNINIQIQDLKTNKHWYSNPVPFPLVAGAGGSPLLFPAPRVIEPNGSIRITATNQDPTAGTFFLTLAFIGTKIYYAS